MELVMGLVMAVNCIGGEFYGENEDAIDRSALKARDNN
jgi:hypothetical protein